MTKKEFIDFIESSLDFLDSKEKDATMAFFAEKLSLCACEEDEKATIEAFGDPSDFIEKFKADHRSFQKNKKNKEKTVKNYLDSRFRQNAPVLSGTIDQEYLDKQNADQKESANNEDKKEESENKASKEKKNTKNGKGKSKKEAKAQSEDNTEAKEKKEEAEAASVSDDIQADAASEQKDGANGNLTKNKANVGKAIADAINTIKNDLILPLLSKINSKKKVADSCNDKESAEPIDEANGLTAEEIDLAKAETLEKANSFYEHEDEILNTVNEEKDFSAETDSEEEKSEDTAPIPLEEEEENGKKLRIPKLPEIVYPGLFNQFVPKDKYSPYARLALLALLTLAVSPALAVAFGLVLFIYAGLVAFILAVAGVFFAIMIVLIACGVVELVHGFLLLFDSVPAALIEIGFGTVLFSIVTAIGALVYEFAFGIVPKWLKWITSIFIRYTKLLFCYLYGGKA